MMSKRSFYGFAAVLAAACIFGAAEAKAGEDAGSVTALHYDMYGRANPDGLALRFVAYRRWGYAAGDDPDNKSSHLQSGLSLAVTPAYSQVGAHVEWMPALFVIARLQYDHYRFFGQNGSLLSFPSGDSAFGDDELDAMKGDEESGYGHRILFRPTLRARLGRFLVVNETDLAYFLIDGDGPYFRESQYDTLIEDGDFVFDNKTMFLFDFWESAGPTSLYAGPYYSVTHAGSADITRQRVGLLASLVPVDGLWFLGRPNIYSAIGYNVEDRNRKGEFFFVVNLGFDIAIGGQR